MDSSNYGVLDVIASVIAIRCWYKSIFFLFLVSCFSLVLSFQPRHHSTSRVRAFSLGIQTTTTARRRRTTSYSFTDLVAAGNDGASTNSETAVTAATLWSVTFFNLAKQNEPGLLCDYLLDIGACAAYLVDADAGTSHEEPIYGEPLDESFFVDDDDTNDDTNDTHNNNVPLMREKTPVWNQCTLTAHFPNSVDLDGILEQITITFPHVFISDNYNIERLPNKDWVIHVQQSWPPIVVGGILLRFPWHAPHDVQMAITKHNQHHNNVIELQLQGGIAFGTGEHPTTQLCLEWIEEIVKKELLSRNISTLSNDPGTRTNDTHQIHVLDYGTGSGVLGLAACAMAPSAVKAIGVDLDYDCCRIANDNAAMNKLDHNMRAYLPPLHNDQADAASKSLLLKAYRHAEKVISKTSKAEGSIQSVFYPDSLNTTLFDIGVANILATPLLTLATTLASMVRPGGHLGLSGILHHQQDSVRQAYQKAGFQNIAVQAQRDGWVLMTGTRVDQTKTERFGLSRKQC